MATGRFVPTGSRSRAPRARGAGKLADLPGLRALVEDKLMLCWSPRQISRHLEHAYPHDPSMRVSHETIYTSLFVQAKGVLRPELTAQLRTRRVRRRPQKRMSLASRRNRIPNMLGIAERPAQVADRVVPGHWEGDLIVGRYGRSHLVTLVERHADTCSSSRSRTRPPSQWWPQSPGRSTTYPHACAGR